jgi:hypothetical protein
MTMSRSMMALLGGFALLSMTGEALASGGFCRSINPDAAICDRLDSPRNRRTQAKAAELVQQAIDGAYAGRGVAAETAFCEQAEVDDEALASALVTAATHAGAVNGRDATPRLERFVRRAIEDACEE